MDLQDFIPSTDHVTVELKIKDKNLTNKDGSKMTLTVLSPFSKEYKKILHGAADKRIKLKEPTVEDLENLNYETLVESTVGWDITWGGEKVEFSKELAREIYEKAFWIKLQIQEAQADTADFTIP